MQPVYAHTTAELDAWSVEWEHHAKLEGFADNVMAVYEDWATRHPRYFGRHVNHPLTLRTPNVSQTPKPFTSGVEQWRSLVATYFRPGDVDRALRIMACESGGNPNAKSPISSASGLMQHLGKYWATRSAAAGFAGVSIFDPTANVATAAWLRDQPGGWLHWRACL